mmetsp:Transcript_95376/g.164592  ORF Transcript_95376/g.164592 Transcript_95376/m.164592 type:complete len:215 (+) Transcript_95376:298-942(+)
MSHTGMPGSEMLRSPSWRRLRTARFRRQTLCRSATGAGKQPPVGMQPALVHILPTAYTEFCSVRSNLMLSISFWWETKWNDCAAAFPALSIFEHSLCTDQIKSSAPHRLLFISHLLASSIHSMMPCGAILLNCSLQSASPSVTAQGISCSHPPRSLTLSRKIGAGSLSKIVRIKQVIALLAMRMSRGQMKGSGVAAIGRHSQSFLARLFAFAMR